MAAWTAAAQTREMGNRIQKISLDLVAQFSPAGSPSDCSASSPPPASLHITLSVRSISRVLFIL